MHPARNWLNILVIESSAWYTSATFWSGAGVAVAVLVGAGTVLVTWLVGAPRRLLVYAVPVATPLLASHDSALKSSDLQVMFQNEPLRDAHFVSLIVTNKGRRDIRSGDFDQGRPVVFDMQARVVSFIGTDEAREGANEWFRLENESLEIWPTLIRRRQVMAVKLIMITEGVPNQSVEVRLQTLM